ncbi:hydrogenase [Bradyrhizobium jicamae]|nr:hydrogenase [Bradyrhizobium jicamae]
MYSAAGGRDSTKPLAERLSSSYYLATLSGPDRLIIEGTGMDYRRRLLFHGICLFLIGLFTGLAEQHFANVRMALAAHLEGVMNGTFLLAVGAVWRDVKLSSRASAAAYWTLLGGTYGNWAVTTLAASLGTAALSPITGAGHSAPQWQESLVTAGFITIGLAIIAASVLLLWGLRGKAPPPG